MRFLMTAVTVVGLALSGLAPRSMAQSQPDLDSLKADPQHHTLEFENEQVRVVRYIIPPHEKTALHAHPSLVNVLLTDSNVTITTPDNKTSEAHARAGSAVWRGPTTHVVENIGAQPIEGILVEPKKPHSARPAGSADEVSLPGSLAKVEFENDQIRVIRYHFEPGQKNEMHGHPDTVQIALTDAKATATSADNKTTSTEIKAGQVRWRPALVHSVQNTGDQPFTGILVEMKGMSTAGQ